MRYVIEQSLLQADKILFRHQECHPKMLTSAEKNQNPKNPGCFATYLAKSEKTLLVTPHQKDPSTETQTKHKISCFVYILSLIHI